ncbi:type II secretion system F family protein [Caenimonas sedimenti]|uniref:Type II secretion system F family protein n=1 Tax=Caenimonas sedimenti TaxID=2596921 RepID=A0A562ZH51_9BURK|nr:type II secretion system F family protein [Caenimonas sedimenti]TWO67919.1 type II secretion system F family protein [Caenimonas sedimenti]
MPDFAWRASDAAGRMSQGTLEAATAVLAARQLRERGLVPVSIEAGVAAPAANQAATLAQSSGRQAKGPVTQADVLALTSELAIMLRAGLALANALRVLIDMSHKPSVAQLLQAVLDDVKGGAPLSQALARERALFGDFYLNMVRSGEASGQLSAVLTRLVEHMERLRALRESVISATIYPAILLGVAIVSVIAMLGFVVPQFEKLFNDMGDALPLATRIVMIAGQLFRDWGLVIGIVMAAVAWLAMRWARTPAGQAKWESAVLRIPLFGRLLLKFQLNLFSRSLGTLLGNGVPMLTALHIATQTVGNQVLRSALVPIAPAVKEGGRLVDALRATGVFEPIAINLVRVGEETGRVGPMMLELANILDRDVETGIRRTLTLIEPALIIVLGLMIAGIIVSIMLGILSINDLAA